jgi:iron complex transport system substrate-binding protein
MRDVLIALLWLVCASVACADIEVVDSLGRKLVLTNPATQVISLAPHLTDVAFAAGAGAGEALIGAAAYSDYSDAARKVPRVGSSDSISYETPVALSLDLVLTWRNGNRT